MSTTPPAGVDSLTANVDSVEGGRALRLTAIYSSNREFAVVEGDLVVNRVFEDLDGTVIDEQTLFRDGFTLSGLETKEASIPLSVSYTSPDGSGRERAKLCAFLANMEVTPFPGV